MAASNDLSELLDRIANGKETEDDRQVLRQLLQDKAGQSVVQLGKYTVNLGQGRERFRWAIVFIRVSMPTRSKRCFKLPSSNLLCDRP